MAKQPRTNAYLEVRADTYISFADKGGFTLWLRPDVGGKETAAGKLTVGRTGIVWKPSGKGPHPKKKFSWKDLDRLARD
ncbi:MAG: hypothetical protein ACHQ2Y_04925 [Candidatus Lutacidiplasmatales archaeon]